MSTDVEIASQALELAGLRAISSWSDGPAAIVAQRHYERTIRTLLEANEWKFARWTWKLENPTKPISDFQSAFTLPADLVWPAGSGGEARSRGIVYARFGNEIWCDYQEIFVRGVRRQPEAEWPAYFVTAAVFHLGGVYAIAIRHDAQYGASLIQIADARQKLAQSRDAQQQTAEGIDTDWPLISVRG